MKRKGNDTAQAVQMKIVMGLLAKNVDPEVCNKLTSSAYMRIQFRSFLILVYVVV
jgi:hypothetical protein